MVRAIFIFICRLAPILLGACDLPGGYVDLAEQLDTTIEVGNEGHSTWLRRDSHGVELALLGELNDEGNGQIVFMMIEENSQTMLTFGAYTRNNSADEITVDYQLLYSMPFDPDKAPINKEGATKVEMDTTVKYQLSIDEDTLTLDGDSESRVFRSLTSVLSTIDPTTEDGAIMIGKFYKISILTSQARVPGFGGARMVQYINKKVSFKGMISGEFTLESSNVFEPETHIVYKDFVDYSGISLNGDLATLASMSGRGHVFNSVDFTMTVDPHNPSQVISGTVFYGNKDGTDAVKIVKGVAGGGTYKLTINGGEQIAIDWEEFNRMDFSSIL
ncbi:MAG: hypothetical protein GY847_00325 [Proteobacteria bacterium]|nr:hypothetical protein [Pseudomonadota bacterium]